LPTFANILQKNCTYLQLIANFCKCGPSVKTACHIYYIPYNFIKVMQSALSTLLYLTASTD